MCLLGKNLPFRTLKDFIYQCQHLGISQWEIHQAIHQRKSQRQQVD